MTARTEDGLQDRPPTPNAAALWTLLALLAVCFTVNDLLAAKALSGTSRAWQPLAALAVNLVMVGGIWGLSRLRPSTPKAAMLSLLLGVMALAGFGVAVTVVKTLAAAGTLTGPWPWRTAVVFTSNLLIGVGAIWGFVWLRPWRGWKDWSGLGEPVSPTTRRTNKLYWLKELLVAVAMLALIFGAYSKDHPFSVASNGPIPMWIAVVAIPCWLLARVLREWWRSSADEHERRASDFGRNAAAGVFLAVTPAWWVAARAGLAPQPDAMALWILAMLVSSVGWTWRRYN